MKTKTINLYTVDELSEKAREKARRDWTEDLDSSGITEDLKFYLTEDGLLKNRGIELVDGLNIYWSLSHCQGDGVMFEGDFLFKGHTMRVRHSGHYYHAHSKILLDYTEDCAMYERGDGQYDSTLEKEFDALYVEICKELEKKGYECIEHSESMEEFKEVCKSMDYYFTEDGEMEN